MAIIAQQTTQQYSDAIQGGTATSGQLQQARGQSFTSDGSDIESIDIYTYKVGTPTGNWVLTLRSTSITGTVLGTVTKACSLLGSGWASFTFSTPIPTTNGVKYYIQIVKSPDTNDTTNYGQVALHDSNLYAGGGYFSRNNNAWGSEDGTYDMLFIVYSYDYTGILDQQNITPSGTDGFGLVSYVKEAQSFKPSVTSGIGVVGVKLTKEGLPTDEVVCKLYSDTGGLPGTLLEQSSNSIAGSSLSTDYSLIYSQFLFSGSTILTAETLYWFVFERTGSTSNTNYYYISNIAESVSDTYFRGYQVYFNGSNWIILDLDDSLWDLYFKEFYVTTTSTSTSSSSSSSTSSSTFTTTTSTSTSTTRSTSSSTSITSTSTTHTSTSSSTTTVSTTSTSTSITTSSSTSSSTTYSIEFYEPEFGIGKIKPSVDIMRD